MVPESNQRQRAIRTFTPTSKSKIQVRRSSYKWQVHLQLRTSYGVQSVNLQNHLPAPTLHIPRMSMHRSLLHNWLKGLVNPPIPVTYIELSTEHRYIMDEEHRYVKECSKSTLNSGLTDSETAKITAKLPRKLWSRSCQGGEGCYMYFRCSRYRSK